MRSQRGAVRLQPLLQDLFREANITSREAVMAIPAGASFITTVSFPPVSAKELTEAIPFEARRYVPIPITEVELDWEVLGLNENRDKIEVILMAVPKEIIEKFKRVAQELNLNLRALEVETFSMVRSLAGTELVPTCFINLGHKTTSLAITDRGKLRASHNFSRGSSELTKTLERGLGINHERAETLKRETGLSEKMEEKEVASVIAPFIETLFAEIERFISIYNRRASRSVQKINLTGGGSNLKGLVEYTVAKFGLEVAKGNPFARTVAPSFMQPILREFGSSFAVAAGLALHELTVR
jgi:type IV pilus assembly protein PilM